MCKQSKPGVFISLFMGHVTCLSGIAYNVRTGRSNDALVLAGMLVIGDVILIIAFLIFKIIRGE